MIKLPAYEIWNMFQHYLSACDNLMSDRNYTLLMAKLAAAHFEK
jgi:hypothetical protein